MPRSVELQVYVGVPRALGMFSHGRIRKWQKIGTCPVHIPSSDTAKVTHTPMLRQRLLFGSEGIGSGQNEASYVEGASTMTPRSHKRESIDRFELQAAMDDEARTTGILNIRTFWPLPAKRSGSSMKSGGVVPPQPLAETSVMESLHRAFDEGSHIIPIFTRKFARNSASSRASQGADPGAEQAGAGSGGSRPRALSSEGAVVSRTQQLLDELRFDPNHPLLQQTRDEIDHLATTAGGGQLFDPSLKVLYCGLNFVDWSYVKSSRRFQKLALRAQKSGGGHEQIAATDKEVRMQMISANARAIITGEDTGAQDGAVVQVKLPGKAKELDATASKKSDAAAQKDASGSAAGAEDDDDDDDAERDFIAAIQERVRMVSSVKKKFSIRTVVREHGQDAEPIDWAAIWVQVSNMLKPKRPLKPALQQRNFDPSSKRAGIHINVSKLYNVPV
eukprot:GSA25T00015798001.1